MIEIITWISVWLIIGTTTAFYLKVWELNRHHRVLVTGIIIATAPLFLIYVGVKYLFVKLSNRW